MRGNFAVVAEVLENFDYGNFDSVILTGMNSLPAARKGKSVLRFAVHATAAAYVLALHVGAFDGAARVDYVVEKHFVLVDKIFERRQIRIHKVEIRQQAAAFALNAVHVIFGDGEISKLNLVANVGNEFAAGFERLAFIEFVAQIFFKPAEAFSQSDTLRLRRVVDRFVAGGDKALKETGVFCL